MPRIQDQKKTEQLLFPIEVQPGDLPPGHQPGKRGRPKQKVRSEIAVPSGDVKNSEPTPSSAPEEFVPVKDLPLPVPIPIVARPQFEEIGEIIRTICREGIDLE